MEPEIVSPAVNVQRVKAIASALFARNVAAGMIWCNRCSGETAARNPNWLLLHCATVHEIGVYVCPSCKYTTNTEDELSNHVTRNHESVEVPRKGRFLPSYKPQDMAKLLVDCFGRSERQTTLDMESNMENPQDVINRTSGCETASGQDATTAVCKLPSSIAPQDPTIGAISVLALREESRSTDEQEITATLDDCSTSAEVISVTSMSPLNPRVHDEGIRSSCAFEPPVTRSILPTTTLTATDFAALQDDSVTTTQRACFPPPIIASTNALQSFPMHQIPLVPSLLLPIPTPAGHGPVFSSVAHPAIHTEIGPMPEIDHHWNRLKAKFTDGTLFCSVCSTRVLAATKLMAIQHVFTHMKTDFVKCQVENCPTTCLTKVEMEAHIRQHFPNIHRLVTKAYYKDCTSRGDGTIVRMMTICFEANSHEPAHPSSSTQTKAARHRRDPFSSPAAQHVWQKLKCQMVDRRLKCFKCSNHLVVRPPHGSFDKQRLITHAFLHVDMPMLPTCLLCDATSGQMTLEHMRRFHREVLACECPVKENPKVELYRRAIMESIRRCFLPDDCEPTVNP